MKFSKILLIALMSVVFVACNFKEEIYFNEDGTGKMSISFEGGELMQMLPDSDSLQIQKAIDSTIVFKHMLSENKDSIAQLSQEQQAKLKRLEPFSLHMKVEPENGVMNFDMFTDFQDVSEMNAAFNTFQNASSIGPFAGGRPMPVNSTKESTEVNYSFKRNKFKRKTVILNQELFEKSLDSLGSAEMFLSSSRYTFKYHFPRRVKSTNIEEATFSMDGKTMIHEVDFLEMMRDPESIVIEVELEK